MKKRKNSVLYLLSALFLAAMTVLSSCTSGVQAGMSEGKNTVSELLTPASENGFSQRSDQPAASFSGFESADLPIPSSGLSGNLSDSSVSGENSFSSSLSGVSASSFEVSSVLSLPSFSSKSTSDGSASFVSPSESPSESFESSPFSSSFPEEPEKRVSFLAAGDNLIHEAVYTDAMTLASTQAGVNGYSEKYYFDPMYADVLSLIERADVAFVNHECPVAGDEEGVSGYPYFNSPVQSVLTLKRIGFDVINLANNHMLDMEKKCTGYKNTVANVKATGVLTVGGYTKADYDALRILEKNGIKIAFLSYTTCVNTETVNSASPEMIIPWAAENDIRRQTALARENADFLVVSMHWGTENSKEVNAEQRRLARLLNECGADVILGHHSHTVQSVEWIGEGAHRTLCYYSLGNFISTQHPILNLTGIFASFELVIKEDGSKKIEQAKVIPHMTWYSKTRDTVRVYLLENVTEELIENHGSQLKTDYNGGRFSLFDVQSFITDAVSDEFLG